MSTTAPKKRAKRPDYWMKATIWTPKIRSEIAGTPAGVIVHAFHAVDDAETRRNVIANLKRIDEKKTAEGQ